MTTGNRAGTLETLGVQIATLLASLGRRLADGDILSTLAELGYRFPAALAQDAGLQTAVDACVAAGANLGVVIHRVVQASDADDLAALAAAALDLVTAVSALLDAADALSAALSRAAAAIPDLPSAELAEFVSQLPRRMIELAIITALEERIDVLAGVLDLFGIIERTEENVGSTDPLRPQYTRMQLRLDRLPKLLTSPGDLAADLYGWGSSSFDGKALFSRVASVLSRTGFPAIYDDTTTPPVLELVVAQAEVAPLAPAPGVSLRLRTSVDETFAQSDETGLQWSATVRVQAPEGSQLIVTPDGAVRLAAPGGSSTEGELHLNVEFEPGDPPDPVVVLGQQGGTRLQVRKAHLAIGTSLAWNGSAGASVGETEFFAAIDGGELILTAPTGDGFLGQLLPSGGDNGGTEFALEIGLQRSGFYLRGSAALDLAIAVHREVGPLTVDQVLLSLRPDGEQLTAVAAAALRVQLGPVQVVLDRVGLRLEASFPQGRGNLGPLQLDIGLESPSGAGVQIDAAAVSGGGFLFRDATQELYAGSMQLSLNDTITLTAFGLIATRMPDGSPGYSLVIFITADGFEPIPLGLGFTLQGIGGMIAVNRTFDQDVLRAGIQNDTLKSLLFPRDPVVNAPTIIRSLASAFPAQRGSYLFGILARIDWFTPTLIEFDLALILEIGVRERLLMLGRVSSRLPSADNDLVRINLDAIGVLDFDQDTAAIDAVLVDSRLAHKFALTGKAALRAGWGSAESTDFVLSIGGFNPRFAPPAGVPPLARVQIALCSGTNPRLTCDAYFAITSNTIQFGASAQLYAEAYGFSISGDIGYDVLIVRAPLHFLADFHASVQLKHGSDNLFKVSIEGELEGPRPLRVSGKASFEIFWCDFSVHFDKTLVEGEPPPLPPAVDVLAELEAALSRSQSWSTRLAPNRTHGVALRKLPPNSGLVLDPLGQLAVDQSVVALDTGRDIDNFGGAPVSGARRFAVSVTMNGVALTQSQSLQGRFAPAQFFAMTDDEKLASPAFETMKSGLAVGSDAVSFGPGVAAPVEYQAITIDPLAATSAPPGSYALPAILLTTYSASGAAARAPLRRQGRARFRSAAPVAVSLAKPIWAIVPLDGGPPITLDPSVKTWTDYRAALAALNRGSPGFQLVPASDIAA